MISLMGDKLTPARKEQLRMWLLKSQRIADAHAAAEREAAEAAATQEAALLAEASQGPAPKKSSATAKAGCKGAGVVSGPSLGRNPGSPSDTMALDEELSKQVWVEEAITTIGEAVADAASEDGEIEFDFELELFTAEDSENDEMEFLHSLDLSEMYGDGLSVLLQHLTTSRQPSVQAWLQLKQEAERSTDTAATWTSLSALEEDFLLINHEHLRRNHGDHLPPVGFSQSHPQQHHMGDDQPVTMPCSPSFAPQHAVMPTVHAL